MLLSLVVIVVCKRAEEVNEFVEIEVVLYEIVDTTFMGVADVGEELRNVEVARDVRDVVDVVSVDVFATVVDCCCWDVVLSGIAV